MEEGNEIRLGGVWGEVSDVDGGVVRRGLLDYGLVGNGTAGKIDRGRNSDGCGGTAWCGAYGWAALSLLICPIDSDGTRAEPLAVHGGNCLLSVGLVAEGEETVTTRFSRIHIPHDSGVGEGTKGTECLGKNLIVNLRTEIANEDMEVRSGVLLILTALICPIDANLCIKYLAAIEGLKGSLSSTHVHVLNETVVEATVLVVAVGDDFYMLDWTSDGEDLGKHVLGDPRGEVSDVEMGASLSVGGVRSVKG